MAEREQPVEAHLRDLLNGLALGIDEALNGKAKSRNPKTGFCLLVFPFVGNPGRRSNYISTANRADAAAFLREQADKMSAEQRARAREDGAN